MKNYAAIAFGILLAVQVPTVVVAQDEKCDVTPCTNIAGVLAAQSKSFSTKDSDGNEQTRTEPAYTPKDIEEFTETCLKIVVCESKK